MHKRYVRFVRFGLVGGSGVIVNMAVLALTYGLASIPLAIASVIAIQSAILTNFIGHHLFTFRGTHGSMLKRFVTFETISISTAALSWIVLNGLAFAFGTRPSGIVYVYNLIAIAMAFIANYALNASSTWKDHDPDRLHESETF